MKNEVLEVTYRLTCQSKTTYLHIEMTIRDGQWTSQAYKLSARERQPRACQAKTPLHHEQMGNFILTTDLLICCNVLLVLPERVLLKDYARIFGESAVVVIGWKIVVWWEVRLRCCARWCSVSKVPCLLLR